MKIEPAKSLRGVLRLNGDKSISHRAAMFSAIADGAACIEGFSSSADCASTLDVLRCLGVKIERDENRVTVYGVGKNGLQKPSQTLDCGNSGTTMRLMCGILAGQNFDSVLSGDESLSKRPMRRIIAPLEQMSAKFSSAEGLPPLSISAAGKPLQSISYELPVASAQVKSGVLLAGLYADGETSVIENTPTRDHTERMFRWLGADVRVEKIGETARKISVKGTEKLTARDISVPSDISSAAFFLVGAACLPASDLTLQNVGWNVTRAGIVEVLKRFGANIEIINEREVCGEPVADIRVRGAEDLSAENNLLNGAIISNVIDELPVIAFFGSQTADGLEIRDAKELRVKESDRIAATVENLRRMGAEVEEFEDGLRVGGRQKLRGARLEAFGDHRIAMASAVGALFAEKESEISGADCVNISFPEFFHLLKSVIKK